MSRYLRNETLLHVIFWVVYLTNEVVSFMLSSGYDDGAQHIVLKELLLHIPIIGVFYFNYSFLIPRYLLKKRYIVFAIWVVILFPTRYVLYYLDSIFLDWYFGTENMFVDYTMMSWASIVFNTLFYLLISTGAKFTRDWFYNRKRIEELEQQQQDAELSLLQYQISPHFLFNTLNNIYSLVQRKAEEAPEAVLKFSNIMRYAMKDTFEGEVSLQHEVDYLRSFIELHRLRLERPEIVAFEVEGEVSEVYVPPMLLIPFVENAFKHGDTSSPKAFISIRLRISGAKLEFTVHNRVVERKKDDTTGIGIPNVTRRLELLYPDKHTLDIASSREEYRVALTLDLQ